MKITVKISLLLIVSALMFACGSENDKVAISDNPDTTLVENFKISGEISGAVNQTILIQANSQQGMIEVAKTQTDSEGKFEIIGNIPEFGIYQMVIGKNNEHIIPLTMVPQDNLTINADLKDLNYNPNFKGTEWSSEANEFLKTYKEFNETQKSLLDQQGTLSQEELMKQSLALKSGLDKKAFEMMKADPGNPFNILLSLNLSPQMGFENWDINYLQGMKDVYVAFNKKFPNSKMTQTLGNQISQIEQGYNEYKSFSKSQEIGNAAPEISLKNPEGKTVTLSSLKGKYVLIDFWASWCGPCRKENPNVVRLYKEYKDKGFTVLSVSLDDDAAAWKRAISEDNLLWPNHVSDLQKWNSSMPKLYGFEGIPYTVLVDKQGNIIARGLRGAELEQKLKEIL